MPRYLALMKVPVDLELDERLSPGNRDRVERQLAEQFKKDGYGGASLIDVVSIPASIATGPEPFTAPATEALR